MAKFNRPLPAALALLAAFVTSGCRHRATPTTGLYLDTHGQHPSLDLVLTWLRRGIGIGTTRPRAGGD